MTSYEDVFSEGANEVDDCAVRSVAIVCGASYMSALRAFDTVGRPKGKGTSDAHTRAALGLLGFEVRRVWARDELARELFEPEPELADLEGKDWLPRMLVFVNERDHIAPFFNGHVHDWSANTVASIDMAWEIAKVGVVVKAKTPPVIFL